MLMDSDIDVREYRTLDCGATLGSAPYKLDQLKVDFFYRAKIPQLNEAGWKVTAAEALKEVTSPDVVGEYWDGRVPSGDVGRVAIWSLFENYACGIEEPVPDRRGAIQYFPRLRKIDESDAHWLAEVCLRRFDETLQPVGKSTKDVLIVLPKEKEVESGAQPISRAMVNRCAVKTLEVPREVVDGEAEPGDDVVKSLTAYTDYGFVVFDESTITGTTLQRLGALIEDKGGRSPLAYGTVIDFRSPGSPKGDVSFSLQGWHPLREVARR